MPLAYVKPEEAFEVRIQCTEEQIQRHCDAAPENDRRDFDNRGGLQVPVYHVYRGTNFPDPLTFWYTFDECEGEDNEFDIRELPTWRHDTNALFHEDILQRALDRGLARLDGNELIISKDESVSLEVEAYRRIRGKI